MRNVVQVRVYTMFQNCGYKFTCPVERVKGNKGASVNVCRKTNRKLVYKKGNIVESRLSFMKSYRMFISIQIWASILDKSTDYRLGELMKKCEENWIKLFYDILHRVRVIL